MYYMYCRMFRAFYQVKKRKYILNITMQIYNAEIVYNRTLRNIARYTISRAACTVA